jgi:type II secretory pathway pseudopilin PulG
LCFTRNLNRKDFVYKNMEPTNPSPKPAGAAGRPPASGNKPPARKPASQRRRSLWKPLLLALGIAAILGLAALSGALAGYRSGINQRQSAAAEQTTLSLGEQYKLAVDDLAAARYEVAKQRLEYILAIEPTYPGAAERLAEALAVLYATATPTPLPPTVTPTPTRDPRPVQELFSQAQSLVSSEQWDQAIDTLLAVRQADPAHQAARLDGLLYISLRQRGVNKITNQGNLEGGAYDLALAERFAPLDVQASSWRQLARLYLFGSSFWEVIPEQAVYYFSQVAAAAPGLRDASGLTAAERYRLALVQYGDQLAGKGEWCAAQEQYELSLTLGMDAAVQEKRDNAALQCSPPSATPASETPTATLPLDMTPSPTWPILPTATNTIPAGEPTSTPAPPTATSVPPTEPPPTNTLPPPPSDTPPPPVVEPTATP